MIRDWAPAMESEPPIQRPGIREHWHRLPGQTTMTNHDDQPVLYIVDTPPDAKPDLKICALHQQGSRGAR